MPSDDFNRTHALITDEYADALAQTTDALFPYATTALVRIDEPWADEEPDGDDCREAWDAVRERFDRRPERDNGDWEAWSVGVSDESGRKSVRRLVALTRGIIGRHFLFEVELAREGQTVFTAMPHHSSLAVDADSLPEEAFAATEDSLTKTAGCLVAEEPVAEWIAEERRWSVRSSICKETLDESRASCYGISNLRGLDVADNGTTLRLSWGLDGPISDDPIGRALTWTLEKLHRPPKALPCDDIERAERVADFLAETLRRYDGREIRGDD
ncbi:hypothetical protein C499_05223 [Halogeometricum borinquense DSM 11551]|uniref:Uncharacterized protein n=1 Tax=Halogeometricum borinquense (strain ATCC 700274 / DSM 11551 / JCM 10706 / KCTC 4070 / PR3) TaxID=469382 RepID=E4NKX8_HALBP|nr:hypothetical protein [Halogeometricum borinquense]ADQ67130.1 hypothetical protein Hbor_15600 [Halogeometricum borinquense DSM 11551]ELY29678.1 hypothetical protein C499_05223 [Halogeometricum borinquense DSM 11551]